MILDQGKLYFHVEPYLKVSPSESTTDCTQDLKLCRFSLESFEWSYALEECLSYQLPLTPFMKINAFMETPYFMPLYSSKIGVENL